MRIISLNYENNIQQQNSIAHTNVNFQKRTTHNDKVIRQLTETIRDPDSQRYRYFIKQIKIQLKRYKRRLMEEKAAVMWKKFNTPVK